MRRPRPFAGASASADLLGQLGCGRSYAGPVPRQRPLLAMEPPEPVRDFPTGGPWPLPRTPTACRDARSALRAVLRQWEMEHFADTAELLVSELVTNAVRYAPGPIQLTAHGGSTLRCHIDDGSRLLPRLYNACPDDEFGRGLALVDQLASDWGVDLTDRGKSVWFELKGAKSPLE
ncbi:ATP-binding protein [Streptomyces sp. NPDC006733]|uniref:ATP-binding protein n=1 Tax=Streptomyces sp. NPDC006733 TaxID=3155460 RepID=UPI0033F17C9C